MDTTNFTDVAHLFHMLSHDANIFKLGFDLLHAEKFAKANTETPLTPITHFQICYGFLP